MNTILRKYFKGDAVIWAVIVLLSIFSLLIVYSATGSLAYKYQGGNTYYYMVNHATRLLIGIIIIYVIHLIPYKYFSRLSQLFLIISIPLLVFTLFFGTSLNQASRWLTLPGLGFTIQPSDLAKLALILYLARTLSQKQEKIEEYRESFLPALVPVLVVCALILPANLSTSMMLFFVSMILMFIGRIRLKHLFAFGGIMVAILAIFITIVMMKDMGGRVGTWKHRVESFVSGDMEDNYQVSQAKIAIVRGGPVQLRPGKSIQRNFIPHPYSDFIFAIIIEEYGLTGALVIIALYMYLLFRAAIMVRKSSRTFPAFTAIGLAMLITFQAMINMAVAVNLIPVTGQPLPIISWGGSSMLSTCVSLGIILSVSRGIKEQNGLNTENIQISNEKATENNN
ncbi:MAG: cell division protein FtsW [Bacteroidetes bacterium]|jgi:cell division protein FtsW|nr:cell division protein FtsW [Bacteroidota bacterium]